MASDTTLGLDAKKKTVGAREQDAVERAAFADRARTLPARRLVVIDESSTPLDMTTGYALAPRGQRAYDHVRRTYGSNVTLLAGLSLAGMAAPLVIEGAVNTAVFEAYVQHVLAPTLHPGDLVLLDNLSCHKADSVRRAVHARGAHLLFLPRYSPDFSPIEKAFAKLKQCLRRARAQTFDALLDAIAQALSTISPDDAIGFFTACGFLNLD